MYWQQQRNHNWEESETSSTPTCVSGIREAERVWICVSWILKCCASFFIFLQDSKEGMKCWLLSTRNLSLENHTMTSFSLLFKAAMELNKDIIIQDELEPNQSSINEQSKCKTISWHSINIPHTIYMLSRVV